MRTGGSSRLDKTALGLSALGPGREKGGVAIRRPQGTCVIGKGIWTIRKWSFP